MARLGLLLSRGVGITLGGQAFRAALRQKGEQRILCALARQVEDRHPAL
ncbi:hypothetical protein APY03_6563 [Variovorax sp. WDL1]|nr:hypothetical protein APY03_6563 [Variovorax sp. WDL1]